VNLGDHLRMSLQDQDSEAPNFVVLGGEVQLGYENGFLHTSRWVV
jgi:hypothetical protein